MKHYFSGSLVILALLYCLPVLHAQQAIDYVKAADDYYRKADYNSAAQYYERYLTGNAAGKGSSFDPYVLNYIVSQAKAAVSIHPQVVYNLAESYRKLHYPSKAAPFYQQVVTAHKTQFPLAIFWYAKSLSANGNEIEAGVAFDDFIKNYTIDDAYKKEAVKELANIAFRRKEMEKPGADKYLFSKAAINAEGATYAATIAGDSSILFTSTRSDTKAPAKKQHINRIYQSATNSQAVEKLFAGQPEEIHYGATAVSADGNTLYLTVWQVKEGKKVAEIYKSTRVNNVYAQPVKMEKVNKAGYISQQPFITRDGKYLLFASDMPGGQGRLDLWYATLDAAGNASEPVNLGSVINTPEDEQCPYIHEGSSTLVFASNGRVGMGGYDLYLSKGSMVAWGEPQNAGYPVNSAKDDMYFVAANTSKHHLFENAWLSSDRSSACCLELFRLHKENPLKQVIGQIISCEDATPLAGVAVEVIDTVTGKKVFAGITNEAGKYTFSVDGALSLSSIAAFKGYRTAAIQLQLPADKDADSLVSEPVCMKKEVLVQKEVVVLNNVYYEFGKAGVNPASYPALDEVVALLNSRPGIIVEIGGHTDNKGSEEKNLQLSEARAASVVAYLVSKGIDKNRLIAKGYGSSVPLAPNTNRDGTDNLQGREKNRRTEMKVLQ